MLRGHFCSLLLLCVAVCVAQTAPLSHDTVRGFGTEARSSEFFREWYQYGELQHYLDNYSDYVVYEAETTGEWALPEHKMGRLSRDEKKLIEKLQDSPNIVPGSADKKNFFKNLFG